MELERRQTMESTKFSICICNDFMDDGTEIGIDDVAWNDIAMLTSVLTKYGVQILISENQSSRGV